MNLKVFDHDYTDDLGWYHSDIEIHMSLAGKPDFMVCTMGGNSAEDSRRAAHIVRCVNSHDALVDALVGLMDGLDSEWIHHYPELYKDARIALADAKGEASQ